MRRAILLFASVTALGMPVVAAHAQAAPIALQASSDSYAALVAEAAQRFGIPAAWIRAIMRIESRGDRRAVSPKGAMGLMQLMPETWAALRPRARSVRSARQHPGGRGFPARDARPLRIAGIPRGV
jgi:soluble lytic murein transglycosylase-like protein